MIIKKAIEIPSSEITNESVYLRRREFIGKSLLAVTGAALAGQVNAVQMPKLAQLRYRKASINSPSGVYTDQALTPYEDIIRYNNFYEFGMDKTDPARYADTLTINPWSITVEGEVEKPGTYAFEDILKWVELEERIYRLRCVEAWSMVIPWVGFSLSDLLKHLKLTSKAKYVQFVTVERPEEMRGQRSRTSTIEWPYVEGLRMDEAMHPLTIMATGLYGKELPKQNGAPIRLVVPWKYGFKSIKSIVKIILSEKQPPTTWQALAPSEYGFYANVNPSVDHPRWSQKTERRLPATFLSPNRVATLPFNGYADQVAALYKGMDLHKHY